MRTTYEPPTTLELLTMDSSLREFTRKVLVFETNCHLKIYGAVTPTVTRYRHALEIINALEFAAMNAAMDDFDANCPF